MRRTTKKNKWDWPDELDAIVAAPGNHQVLLENDRVRVIYTTVAIGATTPVHTHRWPSVEYVLSATDFVRRDGEGTVVFDTQAAQAELHPSEVCGRNRFRRTRSTTSATRSCAWLWSSSRTVGRRDALRRQT